MMKYVVYTCLLVGLFLWAGCHKAPIDQPTDSKQPNTQLQVQYKVGREDFAYGYQYEIGGVAIKFSLVQFYLSGIKLGENTFDSLYVLAEHGKQYEMGYAEPKEHHWFSFSVGIDSATNTTLSENLNRRSSTHPLGRKTPAMHWENHQAGYLFMRIKGWVDRDADGTPEQPLDMAIGHNQLRRSVDLHSHLIVEDYTNENILTLRFDLEDFFTNIDLRQTYQIDKPSDWTLAKPMMDNLHRSFSTR